MNLLKYLKRYSSIVLGGSPFNFSPAMKLVMERLASREVGRWGSGRGEVCVGVGWLTCQIGHLRESELAQGLSPINWSGATMQ